MGSPRETHTPRWSVFDGIKPPLPATPEALISSMDAAIAASEHARATALLAHLASQDHDTTSSSHQESPTYDMRLADEAYKAARAALAAGRPDAALRSLKVALARCPPDRVSALGKLRSLVSIASSQQQQLQR